MTDIDSLVGTVFADRYRIIRLIGAGGMAVVYLAEDVRHGREVAVKVLRPNLAESLGPSRFQREIATAARLQHPHILTVFDSGETDGVLWFTMPYVEGESLRTRLARETQLPIDAALQIAQQIAQGLQYAHEHGVVHRDIKPDNILLTRDGNTLIADFGIARAIGESNDTSSLTQTGTSIGTPAYMSPEQASGERTIDARSDIYALGAVVYEMLVGEPPYTGPTAQVIIAKRFTVPVPSARAVRATIPTSTDRAISRALALVPGDRFATADAFATALTAQAPGSVGGRRRSWLIPGAIAAVVLVTAGGGFWWQQRSATATDDTRVGPPRIAVLPFENRGDSADAYFADGMTDAVRGKLAMLPGLEVIARTSTASYAGTSKSLAEIGSELGVRYLLTAVVRWERGNGDTSVVHVTPELVEIRDNGPPTTRWQQPFDQPLTNVFAVQADIASEVASRMQVALAAATRSTLAAAPTKNPAAYDAFLRADALNVRSSIDAQREALRFAERAVTLDSTFAEAWALLAITRSNLYGMSWTDRTPKLAQAALDAAQRGIALDPSNPRTHRALGAYYRTVVQDPDRALEAYRAGLAQDPNDAPSLASVSIIYTERGAFEQAAASLETAERIDPRSTRISLLLSSAYQQLGDYASAEAAASRAVTLTPGDAVAVSYLVITPVLQGDLDGARRVIRDAAKEMDETALYTQLAVYGDLGWVLDSTAQEVAMAAPLSYYNDLKAARDMVIAQVWYQRGNLALARQWGDSTIADMTDYLRRNPGDGEMLAVRALAEAYAGHDEAAHASLEQARAQPTTTGSIKDYVDFLEARVDLVLGNRDHALQLIADLLKRRGAQLTPGRLRIDPTFTPLRDDPRFERLLVSALP
jgi:serine/threonine-protein kinase